MIKKNIKMHCITERKHNILKKLKENIGKYMMTVNKIN